MYKRTHTTEIATPAVAPYALGPLAPSQLTWMGVTLSDGSTSRFLLPVVDLFPSALLADPQFREGVVLGLEWADWFDFEDLPNFATLANRMHRSFVRELSLDVDYMFTVGALIGTLSVLAEEDFLTASVGVSYLCYLISVVPLLPEYSPFAFLGVDRLHDEIVRTYRSRLRFLREFGVAFEQARCFALHDYMPEVWQSEAPPLEMEEVA